jgi:hypothetical protein
MTKYCTYCRKFIDEKSNSEKWNMIITKRGEKIIEFEAFHLNCWKEYFEMNLKMITEKA